MESRKSDDEINRNNGTDGSFSTGRTVFFRIGGIKRNDALPQILPDPVNPVRNISVFPFIRALSVFALPL
jgi:hypothetical protein